MTQSIGDIQAWGESLESSQPQEILAAAVERYAPKIMLACSFGAEDVVLGGYAAPDRLLGWIILSRHGFSLSRDLCRHVIASSSSMS